MTKLFAAHLVQKSSPTTVFGKYDPEQEVWVGDNQFQGANPYLTETNTNTATEIGTRRETTTGAGLFLDTDVTLDTTLDPDVDHDPDV